MHFKKLLFVSTILILSNINILFSQEKNYYQTDFTISEFEARRSKIFNEIGTNAIALIQGASSVAVELEVSKAKEEIYSKLAV